MTSERDNLPPILPVGAAGWPPPTWSFTSGSTGGLLVNWSRLDVKVACPNSHRRETR
jgi:hypothetical protein